MQTPQGIDLGDLRRREGGISEPTLLEPIAADGVGSSRRSLQSRAKVCTVLIISGGFLTSSLLGFGGGVWFENARLAARAPAPRRQELTLVSLADIDPSAQCVDGTPAAYYWQGNSDSNVWLIDLQGGGWCNSNATCFSRCPPNTKSEMCSSKAFPASRYVGGLFSPKERSIFSHANKVFVPYCTSDAHMANAEAFGMKFPGARVIQAILTDLVDKRGLGTGHTKDLVIWSGQSAGGRGAMIHLDYVKAMLGDSGDNVEVVGFLDSPVWLDVAPYKKTSFHGFGAECRDLFRYANVEHLGEECMAQYSGDEAWKCIMGQYRLPHIQTPYFLVASQYDSYQLGRNGINPTWLDDESWDYAENFAVTTYDFLANLTNAWPRDRPRLNAILSWSCFDHAMSLSYRGFDSQTCAPENQSEVTVDMALSAYLQNDPDSEYVWLDDCEGFSCGEGCSEDNQNTIV